MPQNESTETVNPPQVVVSTSQLDNDPIEYASSMTSAYQHDEFDDGKQDESIAFEMSKVRF